MNHQLPKLEYAYDALEPYIDAKTMEIHHTKHHQAYINKLNAALQPHASLHGFKVEQLLRNLNEVPDNIRNAVRNHGGGHFNHTFFWPTLKKGVPMSGPAAVAINNAFGNFEKFKSDFTNAASALFGSGWAWLTFQDGKLDIMTTSNQDCPLSQGMTPILGLDVWEHAYYLRYQNRRPEYIAAFFNIINWERVNENYRAARG